MAISLFVTVGAAPGTGLGAGAARRRAGHGRGKSYDQWQHLTAHGAVDQVLQRP
ncbi:hypothetical protein [Streptomyces canus]|uniref:hypothetical protein n=1 Tax=Streptomyces canus TaxID=58343 RepID=UPI00225896BB|nr:hypothetical protein [Streptomyces canus]MCX4859338.1 hypothetical protein [Streptomyces canus]